jgi:hypothetical protein
MPRTLASGEGSRLIGDRCQPVYAAGRRLANEIAVNSAGRKDERRDSITPIRR